MYSINHPLYQEDLNQAASAIPQGLKDKSILITGASGLIGSFMVDTFVHYSREYGKRIHIYATGRDLMRLQERFSYDISEDLLSLVSHDIVTAIDESQSFDYILHLASNADPKAYAIHPAETITTNVIGTYNVLEYARKHSACRLFLASTMEVYGALPTGNYTTEDEFGLIDFNKLRSGYPEGKRTSELMLRAYIDEYNISGAIGRLGYIYGPTMKETDSKVIAQFIRKALANEDIVLKSKGGQRRSCCYVSDAAAGILLILFKGNDEVYNIANRESNITIFEMAKTTAQIAGTKVIYELPDAVESRGFSVSQDAVLNESKLRMLGWNPQYTFKQGMKRTISIMGGSML